jgi:hypothetical protein
MKIQFNIKGDVPNKNGIIFTQEAIDNAIQKYNDEVVMNGSAFGSLKYTGNEFDMSESAFKISEITKVDNLIEGEIEILETDSGKILKSLVNNPNRICLMMFGDLAEDKVTVKSFDIAYPIVQPEENCA